MPYVQFVLQLSDSLLHDLKLGDEDAQGFTGNSWEPPVRRIFNDRNQIINARRALTGDHPQLMAMSSYGIEEHRALLDQELS